MLQYRHIANVEIAKSIQLLYPEKKINIAVNISCVRSADLSK
jgi:hypothetical protein